MSQNQNTGGWLMDQLDARQRIERWRRTRPPYGRMPEELWEVAVSLAEVDGAYAVARAAEEWGQVSGAAG